MIADYEKDVSNLSEVEIEKLLEDAKEYNRSLEGRGVSRFEPTEQEDEVYNKLLNVSGIGVMGYIEIPSIQVKLSIYHGVDESVLQTGVGHLEGSSLPVGGENTHTLISGHRGLPSAKLFTDMDKLEIGDEFYIHTIGQTVAYCVDQIRIVTPEDLSELEIKSGESLCTLITCTPYSVNSHRLLVRGHQIDYTETKDMTLTTEASILESIYILPLLVAPLLFILLVVLLVKSRK
jgi:sortase A